MPGRVNSDFGGAQYVNITAMDGTDVKRVLTTHAPALMDAIDSGLQNGHGTGLQQTIRNL